METDNLRDASDAVVVIAISRYDQRALAEAYRRHSASRDSIVRLVLV